MPPTAVTVTSTVPLPDGDPATIMVALVTLRNVALLPPKLTTVAPEKLVPVMVTTLPPRPGPLLGAIAVTVGAAM